MRSGIVRIICLMQVMLGFAGYSSLNLAEEIKRFQLTDLGGEVSIRYYSDDQTYRDSDSFSDVANVSKSINSDIQEIDIDVQAKGYVFHPNFLKLDFGGGPVLVRNVQSSYEQTPTGITQTEPDKDGRKVKATYNLNARANFLEKKPYPFSLYFERRNPVIVSGADQSFVQRNTKLGGIAALREWKYPVSINLEAYRLTSRADGHIKPDGSQLKIDDDVNSLIMRFFQTNKRNGYRQVLVQINRQASNSGVNYTANPIVGTDVTVKSMNLDEYSLFGAKREYTYKNVVSYTDRNYSRGRAVDDNVQQIRFAPLLYWDHTKNERSFYKLDLLNSRRNGSSTNNRTLNVGYKKLEEDVGSNTAELQLLDESTSSYQQKSYTVSATANRSKIFLQPKNQFSSVSNADLKYRANGTFDRSFNTSADGKNSNSNASTKSVTETKRKSRKKAKELILGKVNYQASLGYQVSDRKSNQGSLSDVKVKSIVLGSAEVKLVDAYIEQTSIEVWYLGNRQVEGIDYLVRKEGVYFYIRRLVGGGIPLDASVDVYYKTKTGGTFSHTSFDQQYQISADWQNMLNAFAGIAIKDVDITEGQPSIELTSSKDINLGVSVNRSVSDALVAGVDLRRSQQLKGVAPYDRKMLGAHLQYKLYDSTFLRLSRNTVKVDYESGNGNVDLERSSITVSTRAYWRSTIFFSLVKEKDTIERSQRELTDYILKWQWNFRSLYFSLNARINDESQVTAIPENPPAAAYTNTVERDRHLLQMTLERRF